MITRRRYQVAAAAVVLAVVGITLALLWPSGTHYQPRSLPRYAPSVTPAASPLPVPPKVAAAITRSTPVRLIIPSIGVNAPIDPEGPTGCGNNCGPLQVPPLSGPQASDVGWWAGGNTPGQDGPAVLVGHVDSAAMGPLVFWDLHKLVPGQAVEVQLADGADVWFTVTTSQQISKGAFPTQAVYGPTTGPTLRLITCGGTFDPSSGHYTDNLIVFLTASVPTG